MVDVHTTLSVRDLTISYGGEAILRNVSLDVLSNEIFGIIGPANSGKTSFLRALNRMEDFDPNMDVEGEVSFNGHDILMSDGTLRNPVDVQTTGDFHKLDANGTVTYQQSAANAREFAVNDRGDCSRRRRPDPGRRAAAGR